MAHARSARGRAQHHCARITHNAPNNAPVCTASVEPAPIYAPPTAAHAEPALESDNAEVRTVAALLRERYAAGVCTLSTPELAAELGCNTRTIERSHVLLRGTYGARFVEAEIRTGARKQILNGKARRILPPSPSVSNRGVPADLRSSLRDAVILIRIGSIELKAIAADARASAPRVDLPSPKAPRKKARRRPARAPREILPPLAIEPGVPALIAAQHGGPDAWAAVRNALRRPECHAHPDAARLAARTLASRPYADNPGGYFWALFKRARDGDPLVDVEAHREADRRATFAEVMRAAPHPDEGPGEWRAFRDGLDERLAAVRMSGGESEHAAILEAALAEADRHLEAARVRVREHAADRQIAREVGADARLTTPEARTDELRERLEARERVQTAAEREAAALAALTDAELGERIRAAREAVARALQLGMHLAADNAGRTVVRYEAERTRRNTS